MSERFNGKPACIRRTIGNRSDNIKIMNIEQHQQDVHSTVALALRSQVVILELAKQVASDLDLTTDQICDSLIKSITESIKKYERQQPNSVDTVSIESDPAMGSPEPATKRAATNRNGNDGRD